MTDSAMRTQIEENAKAPATVSVDGVSATEHSLPDQIAAAKFLAAPTAVAKKRRGMLFTKLVPPGTV